MVTHVTAVRAFAFAIARLSQKTRVVRAATAREARVVMARVAPTLVRVAPALERAAPALARVAPALARAAPALARVAPALARAAPALARVAPALARAAPALARAALTLARVPPANYRMQSRTRRARLQRKLVAKVHVRQMVNPVISGKAPASVVVVLGQEARVVREAILKTRLILAPTFKTLLVSS
jgi:ribosome-binding protein 1